MKKNIEKKFLPIGTVVQIIGSDKKVMICGRQQKDVESGDKYDFIGCEYPLGLDGENLLLFNLEQILMIYFLGYQDFDEIHQRMIILNNLDISDKKIDEE